MPRNSSGTYTLPESAFVAGTTIVSADMNSDLSDIATALTQSLSTTGVSSMTGPLKLADGSAAAPSLTLASDTTTGWYRSAAGTWTYVGTGTTIMSLSPTGATISNLTVTNLTVTGSFTVASAREVGEVVDYCGTAAPALFLFAFGQAVSRATYSAAFAILGTAFGAGDGLTTFNLPDYRGRVGFGKDDMGGVAAGRITVAGANFDGTVLGGTGGSQNHTMTTAEMVQHSHNVTDPGHTHDVKYNIITNAATTGSANAVNAIASGGTQTGTNAAISKTTGITIDNAGTTTPFSVLSPALIVNKMIYVGV
jgi:microcystin-dependent protein